MRLAARDRLKLVAALQLSKQQLDRPARRVELADLLGLDFNRKIRDVPVVHRVALIPQANDTDAHRCFPSPASIPAPLERDLCLSIKHGTTQPRTNLQQAQAFYLHCAATRAAVEPQHGRIGVVLQASQEEAAVPSDSSKQGVAEVAQIKQQEPALHPLTCSENRSVVNPLGGNLDMLCTSASDVENRMQFQRGQGVIGAAGGPTRSQGVVE